MPLDLIMFRRADRGDPAWLSRRLFSLPASPRAFALLGWWLDAFSIGNDGRARPALLRRHDQIPVLTAIPLFVADGGGAGEVAHRGGSARDDGAVVRSRARRTRRLGDAGGRAARRLDGDRRRDRRGHGPDRAAGHAAQRLQSAGGGGASPPAPSCTAGTLGQIIPPSTLLIILAEVMSSAFQQAQFAMGRFTVETIFRGPQTFAAALVPGLIMVAIYILYILGRALPSCPAMRRPCSARRNP